MLTTSMTCFLPQTRPRKHPRTQRTASTSASLSLSLSRSLPLYPPPLPPDTFPCAGPLIKESGMEPRVCVGDANQVQPCPTKYEHVSFPPLIVGHQSMGHPITDESVGDARASIAPSFSLSRSLSFPCWLLNSLVAAEHGTQPLLAIPVPGKALTGDCALS